jgi:hypothetical protein
MFYKVHVAENDGQEVIGPQSLFDIEVLPGTSWVEP